MYKREKFLAYYDKQSHEREYYESLFSLFDCFQVQPSRDTGFGLIRLLEHSTIKLADGRIIGDDKSIMGSIEDISRFVACLFSSVNDDAIWWKSNYPSRIDDASVREQEKHLLMLVKNCPLVWELERWE